MAQFFATGTSVVKWKWYVRISTANKWPESFGAHNAIGSMAFLIWPSWNCLASQSQKKSVNHSGSASTNQS